MSRVRRLTAIVGAALVLCLSGAVLYVLCDPAELEFARYVAELRDRETAPAGLLPEAAADSDAEVMQAANSMLWGAPRWEWDEGRRSHDNGLEPWYLGGDDWYETLRPADRDVLQRTSVRLRPFRDAATAALARPLRGEAPARETAFEAIHDDLLAGAAADPDPHERLRFLATAFKFARGLGHAECSVDRLPERFRLTLDRMRRGVASGRLDPAEVRAALDGLLALPDPPDPASLLRRQVAGRVRQHRHETAWDESRRGDPWWGLAIDRRFGRPMICDTGDVVVADCRALERASGVPPEDLDAAVPELDDILATQRGLWRMRMFKAGVGDYLADVIAIAPRCALARVWLAVAVHRCRHGEWPRDLAELRPLFPDGVPQPSTRGAPFVLSIDADRVELRWDGLLGADGVRREGVAWDLPRAWSGAAEK